MSERGKERVVIETAVSLFLQEEFKDGDVVSHEWLKTYLEIPDPESLDQVQRIQFLLLSRVEEFKKSLLEDHKIALESVRGIGYRIVPPNEQAAFAVTEAAKQIQKGIERGLSVLCHARLNEMDAESHKRHIDAQTRMSGLKLIVSQERRDVFSLFSESEKEKQE